MRAGIIKTGFIKNHGLIASSLFIVTFLSRIPLRSQFLYSWDSANFALGIINFNVAADRPHFSGYPLYILAGKIINLFVDDLNTCLVYSQYHSRILIRRHDIYNRCQYI